MTHAEDGKVVAPEIQYFKIFMMKYILFILLNTIAISVFALDCNKAVSTPEINECGKLELEKTEKELNSVYNKVLKNIEDQLVYNKNDLKKKLIEAQRLWVKFRETDCDFTYALWSDGTIRTIMYLGCMQERAKQRIKELQEYIQKY